MNAKDDWTIIMNSDVNDAKIYQMNTRYNIEQAVEYLPQEGQYYFWTIRESTFFKDLKDDGQRYVLYNNGEMRIWQV